MSASVWLQTQQNTMNRSKEYSKEYLRSPLTVDISKIKYPSKEDDVAFLAVTQDADTRHNIDAGIVADVTVLNTTDEHLTDIDTMDIAVTNIEVTDVILTDEDARDLDATDVNIPDVNRTDAEATDIIYTDAYRTHVDATDEETTGIFSNPTWTSAYEENPISSEKINKIDDNTNEYSAIEGADDTRVELPDEVNLNDVIITDEDNNTTILDEITDKEEDANRDNVVEEEEKEEDEEEEEGSSDKSRKKVGTSRDDSPSSSSFQPPEVEMGEERRSKRVSVNSFSSNGLSSVDNAVEDKRKKVGHYILERTIGEGSYTKVHVATHLLTRCKVAVKVVTKRSLVRNEAARYHFRREALLLQKLRHPNIVKLHEAMETSSAYYLVLELASNGHLLSYVSQKGNLAEEESRTFMRQIVSAIDHMHKSSIVHRDIKLENILLDGQNNIKLVDFGFSTVCHVSELSTQCGCPVYAAPEVFAGRKYGRPVDIWSLGVCFYGMLLGRLPFLPVSNSLSQLFNVILKGCLIPHHLTPSCQNLLSRMLDLQEGRRISIEEILVHHWLSFPDGQPIRRYPPIPKKPQASTINQHIVKYMCTAFRFSETEIIHSLMDRRLTSSTATYYLLKEKIEDEKWRDQIVPVTSNSNSQEKASVRKHIECTSPKASLPKISTHGPGVIVSKAAARNGKTGPIYKRPRICPATAPQDSRTPSPSKLSTSNAYKSYIMVLQQSRFCGNEPTISTQSTTNEMFLNMTPKYPQSLSLVDTSSSILDIPTDTKTVKHFMRINTNHKNDLGVKGQSPFVHERLGHTSYSLPASPTKLSGVSPSLRPLLMGKTPPPAPPNSSLGIQYYPDVNSPGGSSTNSEVSTPSGIVIRKRTKSIYLGAHRGANRNTDATRPSLSSLRDTFTGGDSWSQSRKNVRWKPRPTVSLLRNKKRESTPTEIQIRGQSQKVFEDKDRQSSHGHVTWSNRKNDGWKVLTDDDDEDIMLQNMTNYFNSMALSDITQSRQVDRKFTDAMSISKIRRGVTFASFPIEEKSNHDDVFPSDDMVKNISIHRTAKNSQPDSSNVFSRETESRLSQSVDRDDFMTPVTRVTIRTLGKNS